MSPKTCVILCNLSDFGDFRLCNQAIKKTHPWLFFLWVRFFIKIIWKQVFSPNSNGFWAYGGKEYPCLCPCPFVPVCPFVPEFSPGTFTDIQSYTNHENFTKFDGNISVSVREILLDTLWYDYKIRKCDLKFSEFQPTTFFYF